MSRDARLNYFERRLRRIGPLNPEREQLRAMSDAQLIGHLRELEREIVALGGKLDPEAQRWVDQLLGAKAAMSRLGA